MKNLFAPYSEQDTTKSMALAHSQLEDKYTPKSSLFALGLALLKKSKEWHRQIDQSAEPSRRQEKWKYTSLDKVSWKKSHSVGGENTLNGLAANEFLKLTYQNDLWKLSKSSESVSIARLGDLIAKGCEDIFETAVAKSLESLINAEFSYFEKINWLSPLDATVVLVKRSLENTEHLLLEFSGDVQLAKPLLFIFEERAELKVFEHVAAEGGSFIFSSFYFLSKGANLERVSLQEADGFASCFQHPRIIVQDEAVLRNFDISLGAQLSRNEFNVKVDGKRAEAFVYGLYVVSSEQTHDHQTFVHHRSPESVSRQFYKGLLNERGRAVFNGRIEIDPNAQKTDSAQLNKNLMLSSSAEIFAKPELEVGADDVKAAHGATIGELQKEEVFYLQSRAISKEAAIEILSEGFAQEIAFEIQSAHIKQITTEKIKLRLKTIGEVKI